MLKWVIAWALPVSMFLFSSQAQPAVPRGSVQAIACAPSNRKVAAAWINDAIWLTWNRGEHWQQATRLSEAVPLPLATPESDTALEPFESALPKEPGEDLLSPANPASTPDPANPNPAMESTPLALAVGDDGTFAVAHRGQLITGDAAGVKRRMAIPGIRGLFIDRTGGMWIALQNAIVFFAHGTSGAKGKRLLNVPGATAPIRAFRSGELFVFGHAGLYRISLEGQKGGTINKPYPLASIEAAAASPLGNRVYAVSLGRFVTLSRASADNPSPFAQMQDVGAAPSPIKQLVVDHNEQLYVLTDRSGWMKKTAHSWRRLQIRSLAVDADGRVWWGTDFGPVAPAAQETETAGVAETTRFTPLLAAVLSRAHAWPGAPPCRTAAFNPLPICRWTVRVGRSRLQQREDAVSAIRTHRATQFFIGMQFTWRFEPLTRWRCIPEQVRYLADRNQRIREVNALWRLLRHSATQGQTTGPLQAVVSRLDRRHLQELILIKTGIYPSEEEP